MGNLASAVARATAANRPPAEPKAEPTAPPARRPHRPKVRPPRPVDALAPLWPDREPRMITVGLPSASVLDTIVPDVELFGEEALDKRVERTRTAFHKPAQPAPKGPSEMLAYLASRGITLTPTADSQVCVTSPGGALDEATRDAIAAAMPLLRPYLHGTPRRCGMPHTGGTPPEAVTLGLGGVGLCADCAAGTTPE